MWYELYMMRTMVDEAASSTFENTIICICITWKTNELHIRKHHKWQMSECGWKCFNVHIHINEVCCWSIYNDWSYVNSLGLNACKRVVLRTGMKLLFLWCGLVLFRLDETTNMPIYIICIYETKINTGHNEVISFDLMWKYIYVYYISVCICIHI